MEELSETPIDVWKFGGSSFATMDAYRRVARAVANHVRGGRQLCVVISAMSGTTGRLAELLEQIAPDHTAEDRDAVLGSGEILGAALTRAAIAEAGVSVCSLNAFQLGWDAEGRFTNGHLANASPTIIRHKLLSHAVVVISGGQALSGDRLMMLGRNSSDLTSIAVARCLGLRETTIFSDIEGVCSADPYTINSTVMMTKLSYAKATLFAQAGAKILFERSIQLAQDSDIEIQCASLLPDGQMVRGTRVGTNGHGVQVSLPKNGRVVQMSEAAISAIKHGIFVPIVGRRDTFVACSDVAELADGPPDPAFLDGAETPVITIDRDGNLRGYVFPTQAVAQGAQELHDDLVGGVANDANFVPLRQLPSKSRGTHSSIFNTSAEAQVS